MDVPLAYSEGGQASATSLSHTFHRAAGRRNCSDSLLEMPFPHTPSHPPQQRITGPQSAVDWLHVNSHSLILTSCYPDLRDRVFFPRCSQGQEPEDAILSAANLYLDTRHDSAPPW